MEFIIGIACGVVLSLFFSFGPAFLGLIQNSVQYGFRRASAFAIGVSLSDAIMVLLMLTVLKNVDVGALVHNPIVASIGGVVIILLGLYNFLSRSHTNKHSDPHHPGVDMTEERRWRIMLGGFLLNICNPFIWLYWISVVTLLTAEVELGHTQRYIFFAGMLLATLSCDLLKCRLAAFLQRWFTERRMRFFNRFSGTVLMLFGVYLIVSMVVYNLNPEAQHLEQPVPQNTRIIKEIHNQIRTDK